MHELVARMTGRMAENVPVPVGMPNREATARNRPARRRAHRSLAAALMGLGEAEEAEEATDEEADESIIPADAEATAGSTQDIKLDPDIETEDQTAAPPDGPPEASPVAGEQLLTPRAALVAPDVTPQATDSIDPSEVPEPRQAQASRTPPAASGQPSDALSVLLGRASNAARPPLPVEGEQVMTAEGATAAVSTLLHGSLSGEAVLRQGQPMPDPQPANTSKLMEAFQRYGPAKPRLF